MALTDSLISYWKLDEASGNALDAHGSNELTEHIGFGAGIGTGTGKINNGRDFVWSNLEWFEHASNSDLHAGGDITLACWFRCEDLTDLFNGVANLFAKGGGTDFDYGVVLTSTGYLAFLTAGAAAYENLETVDCLDPVSAGVWNYVVCWYDSSTGINIQVNNGTVYNNPAGLEPYSSSELFIIGHDGFSSGFDGIIDEAGLWKRVLTSDERTSLYNGGAGLAYPFATGRDVGKIIQPRFGLWGRRYGSFANKAGSVLADIGFPWVYHFINRQNKGDVS
jgi:hypothetical protein